MQNPYQSDFNLTVLFDSEDREIKPPLIDTKIFIVRLINIFFKKIPLPLVLICLGSTSVFTQPNVDSPNQNLLIVIDGLAPYYVTADRMPNLYSLGIRGVFGENSAAVYPTVTRVNSASIITGSYPAKHGIIHNAMWMPQIGQFNTKNADNLRKLDQETNGEMLTAISVGEIMEEAGRRFFVCGSAGTGNSFLQNHREAGSGTWSHDGGDNSGDGGFFVPESAREEAIKQVGKLPKGRSEATVWAVDAYLHHALAVDAPDFTLMWITELDHAEHVHKPGSPEALEAASHIDDQIGRILETFEKHGVLVNIFVTGDHGFSTAVGDYNLGRVLKEAGFNDQLNVVWNMIYLKDDNPDLLAKVVETLQRNEDVGAIYTRPVRSGSATGKAPGTISTAAIQWNHERSADIIVTPDWNNEVNEFGFAGTQSRSGGGRHGTDSPKDIHVPLIAAGPDIKEGLRSDVPTGNVDFIPTILYLQGIIPPKSLDGRILHELLKGGPDPQTVPVHENKQQATVTFPDGLRYQVELESYQVGSTFYLRSTKAKRGWKNN